MITLCIAILYIFEAIISYMFISNKYTPKCSDNMMLVLFTISATTQFIVSQFNYNLSSLTVFIACNLLLCILCFDTNIFQSMFTSILLAAIMFLSNMCIWLFAGLVFKIDVNSTVNNGIVYILLIASSKLLYFFVAYFVSKISIKESKSQIKLNKTNLLFLLPIASVLVMVGMSYITLIYSLDEYLYILFIVGTILLMFSNVVVFLVHETVIKTQNENTALKLQKQKSEIDTEYYSVLQEQYENSNILIHDIKRHLLSIKELSNEKNFEAINKYIDNLYGSYQINYLKKYSVNKLINVIINRYVNAYKEKGIDFYCDIRDIDFSSISDNDLTSLFDNLLENALEAAQNAENKKIEITVKQTNTNYIAINIWNYCSAAPNLKNGELLTTKRNKSIHGFGLKSIKRIAKKYDGNLSYSFDSEEMKFSIAVVLKIK